MRAEIHALQRRLGVTTIYVTHDQIEAMTLGDRVAVMLAGRLQQVATPQQLYDRPVNDFVAGFIGSPSINLVEAELARSDGQISVSFGEHRLAVDDAAQTRSDLERYVGRPILLGIRPEDMEDASLVTDTPPDRRLATTCDLTEPLGAEVLVYFTVAARGLVPDVTGESGADADVYLGEAKTADSEPSSRLVARVSPKTRISEGDRIELAVDSSRLYFFDPETGAAVS
jgi:multiple sugar transport system ATP-binding protein